MATIDDVAQQAGVSRSTVSYALSGKRPISSDTRRRIERAIESLDYRPHAGARALASSRTGVVGLMAPLRTGVDVNVIMQFVAGVVSAATAASHDVLMVTQEEGVLERVAGTSMVDALVVMDIESDDRRIPVLAGLRQPAVLIGLPADPQGLSCVDLDFFQTGGLAARHLLDLGHRRLALIGSPIEVVNRHTSYAERMTRGFVGACEAAGGSYLVIPTAATVAGAQESVRFLMTMAPDVTAVVVHNEMALPHVIAALRTYGKEVPGDVSLVAVCPETTAVAQSPQITSVDIPTEAIGRAAVEMALGQLDHAAPSQIRLLSPTLSDRSSTQSPAAPPA
ncbi:MAG TPA: LacI family transcriptional regulator [Micrococcales bacterium]|uniref:LacI family DNA-binding transcriptional regulator n=1 Tax=Miniimonas arenae TaxID=676201 RepID=UPI000EDA5753|nr:LacI family DNA-binding transcriptional regulator [Miniimonas arenae]HCX85809.1 LacI family transcriptional regulator [Micrococcales bacterium]